jgi:S-adenosylmethionine uptake transporter
MQAFWILLSSLLFATMSLLIKLASEQFPLAEIIFFRTLPGVLLLAAYAWVRKSPLGTPHWRIHAVRSVVGIASMVLGFYAISHLALGTAACLEYTAPLFMMLYAVTLSAYRPRPSDVVALFGGFAGVLLLLRPSLQEGQVVPFAAGLGSGALAAIAYLQLRRLGIAGEATWRTVFIYTLLAMAASLIALPLSTPSTYTVRGVALLVGVGVTGLVAQLAMTRAFGHGSMTLAATLQYSTVIFATLYGVVIWDDAVTLASGIGLALIVVSGSTAAVGVRKAART